MRDIKFRAWVKDLGMFNCTGDFSITFDGSSNALITMWCSDGPVDEFTSSEVMQFTGLKDKNGIDIYEGDIVHHQKQGPRKVVYPMSENFAGFGLESLEGRKNTLQDALSLYEVIGNIHENPELLEK